MRRIKGVLAVLMLGAMMLMPAIGHAENANRCFDQTGKCISGLIRTYWEQNGGLPVFGYPTTDLTNETNADGFTGPTQWFERDRLEDHSSEGKGVLAGRLGAQKLVQEGRPWEGLPKVGGAAQGCLFFAVTGHSLCPPFRAYWERNGGLPRFGYPISEPVTEKNSSGFTGTFQWFERRRMESHPENQPPYDILLGLLGNEVRAGNNGGGGPAPDPCANIEASVRMVRDPASGCVRYGERLGFGVGGYQPGTLVGFWITAENGDTVGTHQPLTANNDGIVIVSIDTTNYFGYQLGPGNYRAVMQDNDGQYQPSYANFRVLPR